LGLLLFLCYINDLPKVEVSRATPIVSADDTSILITSPNNTTLQNDINIVLKPINIWFEANLLSLNLVKNILFSLQLTVYPWLIFALNMTSKFQ